MSNTLCLHPHPVRIAADTKLRVYLYREGIHVAKEVKWCPDCGSLNVTVAGAPREDWRTPTYQPERF